MNKEKSCGAVVFTREGGEIRYVLVEQRSGNYSFPKGHVEADETEEQTALREIWEETGLHPTLISGFRDGETYVIEKKQNTVKDVVYFLAEYSNQVLDPGATDAVSVGLFSYEEALKTLPTENRRTVLKHAKAFIEERL
jgi:8-oxo-dGTP pyrophosphatase MutT (NUDIX family)